MFSDTLRPPANNEFRGFREALRRGAGKGQGEGGTHDLNGVSGLHGYRLRSQTMHMPV